MKRGTSYLNVPYNFLSAEDYIRWSRLGVAQAIINNTFGTIASNSALSGVGPRATGNLYKDPATGAIVRRSKDVSVGQTVRTRLGHGAIEAVVSKLD